MRAALVGKIENYYNGEYVNSRGNYSNYIIDEDVLKFEEGEILNPCREKYDDTAVWVWRVWKYKIRQDIFTTQKIKSYGW